MKNFSRFVKQTAKKIILFVLKTLAKKRLKKFKGKVIAITGSIGKTSTKDAIFTVLNSQFKVHRSKKSMNTDFGILLTVLDIESGFSSASKWFYLLLKAFINSFRKDLNEFLVLEFGVDKPGDMDFLTSVVRPDIAVFTNISSVHMAEGQFESLNSIFAEKSKLIKAVKKNGIVILNIDDKYVSSLVNLCPKRKVITYGESPDASYKIFNVVSNLEGLKFSLKHKDYIVDVCSSVIGEYNSKVLVPAIICGVESGMTFEDSINAVSRYILPPGRMNLIDSINGGYILDSSYNSSPDALKEALILLSKLGNDKRRVAVLGTMNELGEQSRVLHEGIGKIIPQYCDVLITVGADSKYIAQKAIDFGMKNEFVHSFKTAKEAALFFADKVKKNDLILVKGSQNKVRLENFVKEIMLYPEDAKDLLVRQEKEWKNIF